MSPQTAPWIILFTPLFAAALILFLGRQSRSLSSGLAIASAAVGLVLSWWLFWQPNQGTSNHLSWMSFAAFPEAGHPGFTVPLGVMLDGLSKVMLVVVTTIATLVFIYSIGYMAHEEGYWRYFAGLALFLFSMLGIVLADNFVMMFIFWELVGVSSYILIGHYFGRDSAAEACKQAFCVNRVGDFGFMLGILMLWLPTGTVVFDQLAEKVSVFAAHPTYFTVACVLVFCGTIGKSAQLPLHVWLPNSMEGPTPVSSLLHAATMVAAGVYLLARVFPLIAASATAELVIAWVGGLTALAAGLMATQQNDIKRILAYSTISQLGYMVMGIGLAPTPDVGIFHLFTHAFFKCLLFLCAGSVIVGMHHEQDIWHMGSLKNKMPVTFLTFVIGMLALSGCPFLSGYFSKDLIIAWALDKNPALFWIAVASAALTAFYMFRMLFVVFLGLPRSDHAKRAHESPLVMIIPLMILAVPSAFSGYAEKIFFPHIEHPHDVSHTLLMISTVSAFLLGTAGAFLIYRGGPNSDPIYIPAFANRLYFDDAYAWLVKRCQDGLASVAAWFDRWVVDGAGVQLSARLAWACGFALRFLQLGNIQAYAFFFGAGVVAVVYLLLIAK